MSHRLLILALALTTLAYAGIPTPDEFAGFPVGSEGKLVRWDKLVEYYRLLGKESPRVRYEELGQSTNGNPFVLLTISSPENLARLDELQAVQSELAYPYELSEERLEEIAAKHPSVVLMTCNIHATEIGPSQMAMEAAHRYATSESRAVEHVLRNVVFLLVPSFNPDGQIMVSDWNNRVHGTENVWASLPWLYHPYVGHDNNRDAYMMTQVESRYVSKVLYQDWFPQVYLDQHQQGNYDMRTFVPPFANPINPNVPATVWSEVNLIGMNMFTALHERGRKGISYNQNYTAWWQGGFLRGAWFHNIAGLLTEIASANLASSVLQEEAKPDQPYKGRPSRRDWYKKLEEDPATPTPAPNDTMRRNNYPDPWLGGKWTLRDVVDNSNILTDALLTSAANNRERFIRNQVRMGQDAIEAGKAGGPYAYLVPPDQHDPFAAYRMLELLHYTGVEVHEAEEPFEADGEIYPAGTRVVPMAQPFRAYAKDMLEAQDHPDPGQLPTGSMRDRPYDVTAWTLPLQMGVETITVEDAFQAKLSRLDRMAAPRLDAGDDPAEAKSLVLEPGPNHNATAINAALAAGLEVAWLSGDDGDIAPGTVVIEGDIEDLLPEIEALGLRGEALDIIPRAKIAIQKPRLALYQPWTASMDEGWTRWLLQQYGFEPSALHNDHVQAGELRQRWDAIILPADRDTESILDGRTTKFTPSEYRGGIGKDGQKALRQFVAEGGTLITMGDSVEFALRTFELPLKDATESLSSREFSCPGSLLRILVDTTQPVAYGLREESIASFSSNSAFEAVPGFRYTDLNVLARYPGTNPLKSGWIRGPEHLYNRIAAAEVNYKKGRVILFGFRPQFRAQPHNTFQLLFNAIHTSRTSVARK